MKHGAYLLHRVQTNSRFQASSQDEQNETGFASDLATEALEAANMGFCAGVSTALDRWRENAVAILLRLGVFDYATRNFRRS